MADGMIHETSITLTPVGEGRFEVYLDGEKVYDRKEAAEGDFYPSLAVLRGIKPKLRARLAAAGVVRVAR